MDRPSRRDLLRAMAAAGGALLAGCPSGETTTPAETATVTPTVTATATPGGTETETPTSSTGPPTSEERAAAEERAREYLGLFADGSFQAAYDRLDGSFRDQITPDQLASIWSQITSQRGAFIEVARAEYRTRQNGNDIVDAQLQFERGRQAAIVAFRGETVTGLRFTSGANWQPPAYVDESAFTERELALDAPGDCSLGATLTLPTGDDPVPGVVLVHGSGPNDRDQTIGPNKVFKDLAWGLASRGVAVLRYDKRTFACDVDLANVTADEVVLDDALTAIERLRAVERVPDGSVFLAGHSLGATLAPEIAARDGGVAGVVMLAPLARSVSTALLDQNEFLAERDGTVTDAERTRLQEIRRQVERIRQGTIPDDEAFLLGGDEYWADLESYDAVGAAADLSVPRLVLQGSRDYQVTPEDDFARFRAALSGQPRVTLREYDGLNHLFMPGEGTPGPEEYFQQNHVDERVVTDVATFLTEGG
jgi:hypothetical protein